jgi:hypothetical protein
MCCDTRRSDGLSALRAHRRGLERALRCTCLDGLCPKRAPNASVGLEETTLRVLAAPAPIYFSASYFLTFCLGCRSGKEKKPRIRRPPLCT